jgi:V8-like Glu-specific endopeptidase/tetratricopeptide (TPR) repeat protein
MAKLKTLVDRLKTAADIDDEDILAGACDDLVGQLKREPDTITAKLAHKSLDALRGSRRFEHMGKLAEAFIADGCEDAQVQRQYAQALVENGQTLPAIRMLEGVIADKNTPKAEWADAKGVLGRAWKERALATRGKRDEVAAQALRQAYDSYMDAYKDDPKALYQGINAVALAAWDRGLVLKPKERRAALQSADAIFNHIRKIPKSRRKTWDLAIAGEALIALGREDEAVGWFRDYAHRAEAFSLGGTVRQLTELWKLDETEAGQNLLAPMRAHLLEKPGGQFALSKDDVHQMAAIGEESYEKVLGDIGPRTYAWMQKGFRIAESVALIRQNGRGMGTGFLVRGGDLNPALGDELFVLTNAHVVSDPPIGNAAHLSDVSISFEVAAFEAGSEYEVTEVVWQSHPNDHDASLLRLGTDVRGKMKPLKFSSNLPKLNKDNPQRVYIIGHPGGGEISFSFQDNKLLDYENADTGQNDDPTPRRIHYHTPTEPGSSGSPVFNGNWSTIALHHAGSKEMNRLNGQPGTYPANEGIWIQSIIRARPGPG